MQHPRNAPLRSHAPRLATTLGLATTVGLALALGACKSSDHAGAKSQVAARVNDKEVTISQLNQALQAINPETLTPQVTKQALDGLVDEELLVQAAIKNKLDREPATVAAIEHARRQILAQAYAERMLYPTTPIAQGEVEKYYRDHPALFEQRKLYRLNVYSIQQADFSSMLQGDLNGVHSADQLRSLLDRHEVKYETQYLNSAAEDLPLDKLTEFARANVGDVLVARQPDGKVLLIAVVSLEDKPLPLEPAKPIIEQYLTRTRNAQAIADHLKAQKAAANVAFVGDFAKLAAVAPK